MLATSETTAAVQFHKIPFPDFAFDKLLSIFHLYAIVSGMPESVKEYAATKKFNYAGVNL